MAKKLSIDGFVGQWMLEDLSICDRYIEFFNSNPQLHYEGITSAKIDIKKSTDISMNPSAGYPFALDYFKEMQQMVDQYIEEYPHCNTGDPWSVYNNYNIQYYKPTEAFWGWHSERIRISEESTGRMMAFMTYLNDVTDGGETEWFHQKLKIKPEKGKTVFWPTDWTWTHRGIPSPTQEKYIVTGWFSYYGR
tara:strand:- start:2054 stop:2629 length:576 start_codon:yes stop_codon:yes gene_type:complete